jgi:mRNA interferase RelE/StbE
VAYEIRIAPAADRAITKLPIPIQLAVLDALERLSEEPRPAGCEKVKGLGQYDVFRIRIEKDYRVIYQVRDETSSVLVVKVGDRKEVYRRVADLKRFLQG